MMFWNLSLQLSPKLVGLAFCIFVLRHCMHKLISLFIFPDISMFHIYCSSFTEFTITHNFNESMIFVYTVYINLFIYCLIIAF